MHTFTRGKTIHVHALGPVLVRGRSMDSADKAILERLGIPLPYPPDWSKVRADLKAMRVLFHPDKWRDGRVPERAQHYKPGKVAVIQDLLNVHYDRLSDVLDGLKKAPPPAASRTAPVFDFFSDDGGDVNDVFGSFFGKARAATKKPRVARPPPPRDAKKSGVAPPCKCVACKQACKQQTRFWLQFDTGAGVGGIATSVACIHGECDSPQTLVRLRLTNFDAVRKFVCLGDANWREMAPVPGGGSGAAFAVPCKVRVDSELNVSIHS